MLAKLLLLAAVTCCFVLFAVASLLKPAAYVLFLLFAALYNLLVAR